jgi:hypothetical protein
MEPFNALSSLFTEALEAMQRSPAYRGKELERYISEEIAVMGCSRQVAIARIAIRLRTGARITTTSPQSSARN